MKLKLFDAHNHLHDVRLAPFRKDVLEELPQAGVAGVVVNGTREADWDAVTELAAANPWVRAAFGLHPWYVERSKAWRERLVERLDSVPIATVGEIGLDRWIEGYDLEAQTDVFRTQWSLAVERGVAASLHCLKAWGALWEIVSAETVPSPGFLLHSYGGPEEMVDGFVSRGAYFSFSGYFLHERKAAQREIFKNLPIERLLVETDAPDMLPPERCRARFLPGAEGGRALNSPLNIELCYRALADIRGMPVDELAGQIEENFKRLFSPDNRRASSS